MLLPNRYGLKAVENGHIHDRVLAYHWTKKGAEGLCTDLNQSARHAKQNIYYYVIKLGKADKQ